MYPPDNYYGGYPPQDTDRSTGGGGGPYGGNFGNNQRPPAQNKNNNYSGFNNPSVGQGELRYSMPDMPGMSAPPGQGYGNSVGGFSIPGGPSNMYPPPGGPGGNYGGGGYGGGGGPQGPGGFFVGDPRPGFGPGPGPGGFNGGFNGYPPNNSSYGGYPPNNNSFGGYPPNNNSGGGYPPNNNGPPPPGGNFGRPPQEGRPSQQHPPPLNASAPSMGGNQQQPPRPMNASAPGLAGNSQNRPPPNMQNQGQCQNQGQRPAGAAGAAGAAGPGPSQFGTKQAGTRWASIGSPSSIPADAIRAGTCKGEAFFIGRARYKDSVQVGMVTKSKGGLVVAYDGKPVLFREFEVLCGASSAVKWEPMQGRVDPKAIRGAKPLPCGEEKKGEVLYAATTTHHGRDYGGKVGAKAKYMLFTAGGKEEKTKEYFVLCSVN
ncbi:hypothetical protein FB645_004708 [Coemansia sp. IMI 203386]|nr:hypothetical protein FB645_004708 [Coemansia sp. IMI 203386]